MSLRFPRLPSSFAVVSTVFVAIGSSLPATAATLTPSPLFESVATYSTQIPTSGGSLDETDIYYPIVPEENTENTDFPIALMLQGAFVDQADYTNYASTVASYGFVVVVPNHERTVLNPETGELVTGFVAEQQQVNDTLDHLVAENTNPSSPIAGLVDTTKLGLLGHSFGGFVGLNIIQDICFPLICFDSFEQPSELKAGIFFGTNYRNLDGSFVPIDNGNIPTGLIAGSLDGVSTLDETEATYNQIQNPPKVLITVEGANHYGITNEDNLEREPIRPTLEQAVATETIGRWSGLFLRAHLEEDQEAFEYVYQTGDNLDDNVIVINEVQNVEPEEIPEPTSILALFVFSAIGVGSRIKRDYYSRRQEAEGSRQEEKPNSI